MTNRESRRVVVAAVDEDFVEGVHNNIAVDVAQSPSPRR